MFCSSSGGSSSHLSSALGIIDQMATQRQNEQGFGGSSSKKQKQRQQNVVEASSSSLLVPPVLLHSAHNVRSSSRSPGLASRSLSRSSSQYLRSPAHSPARTPSPNPSRIHSVTSTQSHSQSRNLLPTPSPSPALPTLSSRATPDKDMFKMTQQQVCDTALDPILRRMQCLSFAPSPNSGSGVPLDGLAYNAEHASVLRQQQEEEEKLHLQLQLQLHLQQQQHQVRQHIRPPTLPFATSSPSLRDTLTLANQTHHNTHLDAYLNSGFNPLSDFGDTVDTTATACDMASRADSNVSSRRNLYEEFRLTRSRVIRIYNLPASSAAATFVLTRLFYPSGPTTPTTTSTSIGTNGVAFPSSGNNMCVATTTGVPAPYRMWTLREEYGGRRPGEEDSVWAVFKSHEEACAALSLSGNSVSIATALESDLEPFSKLRKYELRNTAVHTSTLSPRQTTLGVSDVHFPPSPTSPGSACVRLAPGTDSGAYGRPESPGGLQRGYQLSSNPPNPRSAFRLGDWICGSANCAAHNFGRNVSCIGCGSPRPHNGTAVQGTNSVPFVATRLASPRFASTSSAPPNVPSLRLNGTPSPTAMTYNIHPTLSSPLPYSQNQFKAPASQHPILTPSGRALAIGGKVQNVSSDPLAPCIMYWPDNEAFPEPGQIRPPNLANVHQPPILNTGNKGPIEHQPGDWICQKCDYLNWRRRKVCQTCFPYAEGNGDSVSATVQAERIALLMSVVAQTHQQAQQAQVQAQVQVQNVISAMSQVAQPAQLTASQFPASVTTPLSLPYPPTLGQQQRSNYFPTSRPSLEVNARLANQSAAAFPRRAAATPDSTTAGGNILYQTPNSPSAIPPPATLTDDTSLRTGPLLPSFLKNEIKPVRRTRTPSSLSPSSTSSADLSFDEYEDDLASPSLPKAASGFYAQHSAGSGSLSSSSGSSSSLTLGGSIWAMNRDEKIGWNNAVFPNTDLIVGARSRTTSIDPVKTTPV